MTEVETFLQTLLLSLKASDSNANAADIKFASEMVEHHRMAVKMSKAILSKGKDEWIAKLARGIISAQEREIDEMEYWLKSNKPSAGSGGGMNM